MYATEVYQSKTFHSGEGANINRRRSGDKRRDSLRGFRYFDDGQRVGGPERFGRDSLPGRPAFKRATATATVTAEAATVTTTAAAHGQVVGGHLHGHYVLGERPDHLSELVDLVAQVSHAGVPFVQPVFESGDVIVFFPGLGRPAGQLAFHVPQPVHHGRRGRRVVHVVHVTMILHRGT